MPKLKPPEWPAEPGPHGVLRSTDGCWQINSEFGSINLYRVRNGWPNFVSRHKSYKAAKAAAVELVKTRDDI